MSIDIMNRIWWRDDLATLEKFVALALADGADDEDGVCWPAVATIARKCSCSPRAVQKTVARLVDKGLMRKLARPDQSNCYIFNLAVLPHMARPKVKKASRPGGVVNDEPELFAMTGESGSPHTPEPDSPHPRTTFTPPLNDVHPDSSVEPSLETPDSDSGDFKSPDVSLTDFVLTEWQALKQEFPGIAGIRKIDESLAKQIALRAKQHAEPGEAPAKVWGTVFSEIRKSLFLTGQAPPGPNRDTPFKLSLGWVCQTQKFREVINGRYSSERGYGRTVDPGTGRRMGPTGQAVAGTIERIRAARERGGGIGGR